MMQLTSSMDIGGSSKHKWMAIHC